MAAKKSELGRRPRVVVTPANLPRLMQKASISTRELAKASSCSERAIDSYLAGGTLSDSNVDAIREALRVVLHPDQSHKAIVGRVVRVDTEIWSDVPKTPGILVLYDESERAISISACLNLRRTVSAGRKLPWFGRPLVAKIGYVEIADKKVRTQVATLLQAVCRSQLLAGPIEA